MQYFVYILKSNKDDDYYVGCTTNLTTRISRHNSGKTKSLKSRRPLVLIYFEKYNSQEEAYSREKQIKSYHCGEAFKKLIINYRILGGGVAYPAARDPA